MSIEDLLDDIGGSLDLLDVIETYFRLAITPVSRKAKHGRFDTVHVAYPIAKGENAEIVQTTAGEAVRHLRAHGVVCGCIGFDSKNTYWLIRRSQWVWAQWLLNGALNSVPGSQPIRQPKSNWKTRRRNRR